MSVICILRFIPEEAVVWCPFDLRESEFVKQITELGNRVIATHIFNGQDFYTYEPDEHWDCIISNPPFTGKRKIFERALSFGKLILGSFVVDCTRELDPMTEGMLKMMGVFSELERNIISQRVKSGLQNARAKGKQLGRPTTSTDDIPNVFYKHYPKYKRGEINKAEFARLCSLSYPTIFKYIGIVEGRE